MDDASFKECLQQVEYIATARTAANPPMTVRDLLAVAAGVYMLGGQARRLVAPAPAGPLVSMEQLERLLSVAMGALDGKNLPTEALEAAHTWVKACMKEGRRGHFTTKALRKLTADKELGSFYEMARQQILEHIADLYLRRGGDREVIPLDGPYLRRFSTVLRAELWRGRARIFEMRLQDASFALDRVVQTIIKEGEYAVIEEEEPELPSPIIDEARRGPACCCAIL